MKKVGIILGVFFIIIAVVIFLITSKVEDTPKVDETQKVEQVGTENKTSDKSKTDNSQTDNSQTDKSNINKDNTEKTSDTPVTQQPIQQTQVVEKVVTKEVSAVKTISESDLVNSKGSYEVIAFISNKRILLIDENPSGKDKKTLSYCFDVLTPENDSLVLFVTKSVYASYKVQDKLKVNYEVFTNDIGVEFPIVSVVSDIQE